MTVYLLFEHFINEHLSDESFVVGAFHNRLSAEAEKTVRQVDIDKIPAEVWFTIEEIEVQ